jgi:hypothetical protein
LSFAAPLSLLFLIPWLGLVLWLLSGQRHRVNVPFLELWSGPITGPKVKRTIQPPPSALAFALVAMLFAIIGAASPLVHSRQSSSRATLIVDRGVTMSAEPRRSQLYQSLPQIQPGEVILVPPWTGLGQDGSNWKDAPRTAIPTADLLPSAIAHALASDAQSIIVVSDQVLARQDPRIIQIAPTSTPENLDIVRLALAASPRAQAMVRVRNQSSRSSCDLTVTGGGQTVTQTIQLPPRDGEVNYFLDLPAVGDTVEARISPDDDLPADNVAWLVRQRAWPRIEVRSALPAELARMIDVYQSHRPASEHSSRVSIVEGLFALPSNEPAVAVLRQGTSAKPTSGRIGIEFGDHPVTAGVDWRAVAEDAVAAESPGEGWTTLLRSGPLVLVAAREQPVRQVWIGFTSAGFPKRKDFVIFWTNVLDWVGQGREEFTADSMQSLGSEWKLQSAPVAGFDPSPGIYRRANSALRAENATDLRFTPPPQADWRAQLASISQSQHAGIDLRPPMLLLAMLLILASTVLWKREQHFVAV